nr:hypothetical protein [Actinomycetota bacterium]NIS28907.1 hypothetical protein [Actinomycetota bacterium]NIU64340.1 hypothetical protein [Actinomycetota bacterium]NIX18730.1 hypothetical protein [Actinomycetota bacterium]
MTTFSQVIDRTRRRLMTTQREGINTLAAAVDTAVTSWSFDHSIRFVENSRLSVGLEDVYVTSVTPGSTTAQVIRGAYGSDPESHTQGDQVHINPTWSNWDIAQAVNDELVDLSSPANGLFRIGHTDLTFQSTRSGYDLTATDFLDVWRVAYDHPGPETDWPLLRHWRLDQDAD